MPWQWLQANYPEFVRVIPGQRPRSTPRMATGLCTQEGLEELGELFAQYGPLAPGYERALAEASEKISLCIAFHASKEAEVRAYFAELAASETTPDTNN